MAYIVVNDMVLPEATTFSFKDPRLDLLNQEVEFEYNGNPYNPIAVRGTIRNYNEGQLYPPRGGE